MHFYIRLHIENYLMDMRSGATRFYYFLSKIGKSDETVSMGPFRSEPI